MSNPSDVKCMRCGSTRHRTESTPNGMSGECLDCGTTWTISQNTWDDDDRLVRIGMACDLRTPVLPLSAGMIRAFIEELEGGS